MAARGSRSRAPTLCRRSPPSDAGIAGGRSYVCYSRPGSLDHGDEDFDATGHLSRSIFEEAHVPREAEVYLCGPNRFMADIKRELAAFGVAQERIYTEIFEGPRL